MKTKLFIIILTILCTQTAFAAPRNIGVLCLTSKGTIVVRKRCNKKQTKLTAANIADQVGIEGLKGDKGDKGDQGPAGVTGHEYIHVEERTILDIYEEHNVTATCPTGKAVLSRRCTEEESTYVDVLGSLIQDDGTQATCIFRNNDSFVQHYGTMEIDIVCGPVE